MKEQILWDLPETLWEIPKPVWNREDHLDFDLGKVELSKMAKVLHAWLDRIPGHCETVFGYLLNQSDNKKIEK